MGSFLWIVVGGAVGTGARYLAATAIQTRADSSFPFGTLTVNLVGCLLIGLLATMLSDATGSRENLRLALVVGCLGGFTTFSSFGLETLNLMNSGQWSAANGYVLASNLGGLAAAWCGMRAASGALA